MRCAECDTRLDTAEFQFRGHTLCCECMSGLCSWFLDGGQVDAPDMFADLLGETP